MFWTCCIDSGIALSPSWNVNPHFFLFWAAGKSFQFLLMPASLWFLWFPPAPYLSNFWVCTTQNCNYIFTCVHLRTKEKVLFICISLASFPMLGKYHSINICWKSEQISWETQFPFGLPPYSGWKHECVSYDHFPGCGMLSFSPR